MKNLLFTVVLALAGSAWVQNPATNDERLEEAIWLYYRSRLSDAVIALDDAVRRLQSEPGQEKALVRAHVYLAATYVQLGQMEKARYNYREALRSDPTLRLDPDEFPPEQLQVFEDVRAKTFATPSSPPPPAVVAAVPPTAAPSLPTPAAPKKRSGNTVPILLGAAAVVGGGVAVAASSGSSSAGTTPTTAPSATPVPTAVPSATPAATPTPAPPTTRTVSKPFRLSPGGPPTQIQVSAQKGTIVAEAAGEEETQNTALSKAARLTISDSTGTVLSEAVELIGKSFPPIRTRSSVSAGDYWIQIAWSSGDNPVRGTMTVYLSPAP